MINAPRVGTDGVAVSATRKLNIAGASSIALNAFAVYSPTDPNGTIVQDNGGTTPVSGSGTLGILQIGAANQTYMDAVDANGAALASQLAGLASFGATFHLRPGVLIESTAASSGNLTISGGPRPLDPALQRSEPIRHRDQQR